MFRKGTEVAHFFFVGRHHSAKPAEVPYLIFIVARVTRYGEIRGSYHVTHMMTTQHAIVESRQWITKTYWIEMAFETLYILTTYEV